MLDSLQDLTRLAEQIRRKKRKIVFTNGCFDLLHPGHVELLEKAKTYGHLLIVGVNSDQSVKRLKGSGRPVLKLKDRLRLVAALAAVDYVIGFDTDTPLYLIQALRPDVLVKGSDWKAKDMVGRKFAKRSVRVKLLDGFSTTTLLSKIRQD
ncbi:MAG: adenylyltransferase/cytidyltransferase family protein [Elusimicrobia bacterium]|nr:adenylyltransferase/cytidyltransferase family protein [Elusimicrobiota bacterium]